MSKPSVVRAEGGWFKKSKLSRSLLEKRDATDIFLSGNKLQDLVIPPDLVRKGREKLSDCWKSVSLLELSGNRFREFPAALLDLKDTLRQLVMDDNSLKSLPESISELVGLEMLGLSSNELESLPASIGKLSSLKQLHLRWNKLASLPESLADLQALEQLDLSNNLFTELPDCVCRLQNLTKLRIINIPDDELYKRTSQNNLTTLPEDIAFLYSLDTLSLQGNMRISHLPRGYFALLNRGKLRNVDIPPQVQKSETLALKPRYAHGAMQMYFAYQKPFHKKAIKNFIVGENATLCKMVCQFGQAAAEDSRHEGILESTVELHKEYRIPRPKQTSSSGASPQEDSFDVFKDSINVASMYIPDDCLSLVKNFILHGSSVVSIVIHAASIEITESGVLDQRRVGHYLDMIRACMLMHVAFQVVFVFSDGESSDRMQAVQSAVREGIIDRLKQWRVELESRLTLGSSPQEGDQPGASEASEANASALKSETVKAVKKEIHCLPALLNSGVILLHTKVESSAQRSPHESFQSYSDSFHQLANPLSKDALDHYFPNLPATNPLYSCYPKDKLKQSVWPVVFAEVPEDWVELGSRLSDDPGLEGIVTGTLTDIIEELGGKFPGCQIFDPQFRKKFKDFNGYFLKFLQHLSCSTAVVFHELPVGEDGMATAESQGDGLATTYVIISEEPQQRYVLARVCVFTNKLLSIVSEIRAKGEEDSAIAAKGLVPVSLLTKEPFTPKFLESMKFCAPYINKAQNQELTHVLVPALLSDECSFPDTPLQVESREDKTMYSDVLICLEFTNDYLPPSFLNDLAVKCLEVKQGSSVTIHQLCHSGLWGSAVDVGNDCQREAFVYVRIDPFQRHNRLFIHATSECLLYTTIWAPLKSLYPILADILGSRSDVSFKAYPLCPSALQDPAPDLSEYVLYLKPQMDYHDELLKAIKCYTTTDGSAPLLEGEREVADVGVDCRKNETHKHDRFLVFPHKGKPHRPSQKVHKIHRSLAHSCKVYIDTVAEPIPGDTTKAKYRNLKINYATQLLAEKLQDKDFEVTSEKVEGAASYLEKMRERTDPEAKIIVICSVGMRQRFEELTPSGVERDISGAEMGALVGWDIMRQKFNFIPVVFEDEESSQDGDIIPSLLETVKPYNIAIKEKKVEEKEEEEEEEEEEEGLGVSDKQWARLERLTLDEADLLALVHGAERDREEMNTACHCGGV